MLVLPLMFTALVLGVAEIGDIAALWSIGWRTLLYTAVVTSIAILHWSGGGEPDPAGSRHGRRHLQSGRRRVRQGPGDHRKQAQSEHRAHVARHRAAEYQGRRRRRAAGRDVLRAVMLGVALVLAPTPATEAFKNAVRGLNELVMKLDRHGDPPDALCRGLPHVRPHGARAAGRRWAKLGWYTAAVVTPSACTCSSCCCCRCVGWRHESAALLPRLAGGDPHGLLDLVGTGTLPTTLKCAEQNLEAAAQGRARFVHRRSQAPTITAPRC